MLEVTDRAIEGEHSWRGRSEDGPNGHALVCSPTPTYVAVQCNRPEWLRSIAAVPMRERMEMDYKTGKEEAVKAVMDINAQYPENKSYQARNPSRIAGGYLYQVTFRGSNDEQYTNFAFRRGNVTRAYYYIEDFVADTEAVDSTFRDPDFLRLVVASVTSSILCIAVIYAAFDGKSDAVGVLAGLFGTAFGYAVGSYSSGRKQSD